MSDRMKMDEEKRKLIGKGITKALEKKFKTEDKVKDLNLIKEKILDIKKISKRSNISKNEIKNLFQECDFKFWELEGMEEFAVLLGVESNLIPSNQHFNIPDASISELRYRINEDIRQTEAALNEGENTLFNSDDSCANELYNIENVTPEDKEFVNKIIKELDEKLSSMSDEEREEYFKQMGFVTIKDDMPENIKERAQINKIIAKQKKKEYPNK